MKNILDWSKVKVLKIDGTPYSDEEVKKVKEQLLNRMYVEAKEIPRMELAQKLWHADEPTELTDGEANMLKDEIKQLPAFMAKGFMMAVEQV